MRFIFTEKAKRDWRKIDASIKKQILKKLNFYTESNLSILNFSEKLKNPLLGGYRIKIGDYRIIFDSLGKDIFILRIGHRKDIYK